MSRSELDFFHQFIWKFKNMKKPEPETMYGCTRCNQILESYDQVTTHCHNQDCERNDEEPEWLP